ncbi:internal virion protein C [Pseudomonas phage Misse]|nr:internal virion protein C [Pseudomonas phage Misse]
MQVDPRVYDSPTFDATLPERADEARKQYEPVAPVSQASVLVGQQSTASAFITQEDNRREKATIGQSLDAALDEMSPMAAYRMVTAPDFPVQEGFSAGSELPGITMQLDSTSRKWLLESRSEDEFQYRVDAIDRTNRNNRLMGDHIVASFGLMMLDPAYLAVDAVSMGAGHLAAAARLGGVGQRLAVAGTAAAGAVGIMAVENQSRPVSVTEFVAAGMLNGAASAAFYNPITRAIEPRDPAFPTGPLHDVAQGGRVEPIVGDLAATARTEIPTFTRNFSGKAPAAFVEGTETTAKATLTRLAASSDASMSVMAKRLGELLGDTDIPMGTVAGLKRSEFNLGNGRISMREGADDWIHMHEITHALTAERLRYGRDKPDSALGKLATQIDELHATAKAAAKGKGLGANAAYLNSNADEFMAGLFSGDKEFYNFLRTVPVAKGNVLTEFVEKVRQVLGMAPTERNALTQAMGLTEDLMQQPLRIKTTVLDNAGVNHVYTRDLLNEPPSDPSKLAEAIIQNADSMSVRIAKGVSWSLHKTLASFSPEMRRVASILVDDPLDMTGNSVVSQSRAIRAELSNLQFRYEDKLKAVMSEQGFGLFQRIISPTKSLAAQGRIEKQVALEMLAREQAQRLGKVKERNVDANVAEMADHLDKIMKASLAEMKAAGVRGAEDVSERSGYFSRRWDINKIEDIEGALINSGLTEGAARSRVVRALAQGMRRANGWGQDLASDIAKAVIDRTRRKGYFEDSAFRSHVGNDNLAEVRDILEGAGLRGDRLQRAMDVMAGVTDEAGKASVLKHRIDIDMKAGVQMPDGSYVTIADMLDTNLTNITERYLDTVAGRSGLARLGLEDQSAVDALRKSALGSIKSESERGRAAKLMDETINAIQGKPVGEDMPAFMRASQAANRMVGLASSGLWQLTEYAPMMARYGALSTLKYMFKEMPGARQLFNSVTKDVGASTQLKDILTRNSSADIRMRPFVQRLEDNFEIPASAHVQLSLSQAQQMVPYINAQKYVQTHQARVMANLMIDSLTKAARGDKRAQHAFEQYGLKPDIMVDLAADIRAHGMDTAKWSDGTWAKVRGPLTKAADDAVLRNRVGEIPAFAQFSQLGKFIFTFRSFVLGAHNKVLAGTMARDGLAGIGLTLLYQLPLSMLANAANATLQGKGIKDEQELVTKSLGQMGAFGLFSDVFGIVGGEKQQFGAPGLIMIDRLYKVAGQAAQGNVGGTAQAAVSATPILSIIMPIRAIGEALKE